MFLAELGLHVGDLAAKAEARRDRQAQVLAAGRGVVRELPEQQDLVRPCRCTRALSPRPLLGGFVFIEGGRLAAPRSGQGRREVG